MAGGDAAALLNVEGGLFAAAEELGQAFEAIDILENCTKTAAFYCYLSPLSLASQSMTAQQLISIQLKVKCFYENSKLSPEFTGGNATKLSAFIR